MLKNKQNKHICSVRQAAWHRQSWQLEFQSLPDRHITTVKCTPGLLCLCSAAFLPALLLCPSAAPTAHSSLSQLAQLAGCCLVVSAALLAFAPLLSKSYSIACATTLHSLCLQIAHSSATILFLSTRYGTGMRFCYSFKVYENHKFITNYIQLGLMIS